MKIAVLSDIHGNLPALEAVLDDARTVADEIVCLGDIVGYGASPVECIELIRATASLVVAGNHDYGAVGRHPLSKFSSFARAVIEWTSAQIGADNKEWLSSLKLVSSRAGAKFVHSSPLSPESWHYIRMNLDVDALFEAFAERVCFVGHTHEPAVWDMSGNAMPASDFAMSRERRYIVDVGSVGQPRDEDPRACYVVFDIEEQNIEFRRVEYDIESAVKAIENAGLPDNLAVRLRFGA
ncbi:MAG TPA: metallophosphoesterase [candidate division Zixibacteria bacterium]|nr:metallophosphoesterase [candidate division Zixibacteria bacterium]